MTVKEEYKLKINELVDKCNDLSMLDMIYQLLQKSQQA